MSKRNKIIYWIATVWLSLGMVSTGIVQLLQVEEEAKKTEHLGLPAYLVMLVATWKLLGVAAVLLPRMPLIKEWAYAGFFFAMSGATVAHIVMGDGFGDTFPPILLLTLTVVSWYFRPLERRLVAAK